MNGKPSPTTKQSISSPYNFVPLSGFVHLPGADDVSHDAPFEDGWCGDLEIELLTHTPLLVSKGVDAGGPPRRALPFELETSPGCRPAVPGSSIRGMIRNVVEIASFGKLSRLDDRRFGIRDLNKRFYRERMTDEIKIRGKQSYVPLAHAGWLRLERDEDGLRWIIEECRFARIDHSFFRKTFPDADGYRNHVLDCSMAPCAAIVAPLDGHRSHGLEAAGERKFLGFANVESVHHLEKLPEDNTIVGYIVVTDQIRKKKREFFFYPLDAPRSHAVAAGVMQAFLDVNPEARREDGEAALTAWGRWRSRLMANEIAIPGDDTREPGIPVFFLADADGRPIAIGLTQMFKLPSDYTTRDMACHASPDHASSVADVAERLFGYTDDRRRGGLKGRVSFSHLISEHPARDAPFRCVLNSPKPTFFPAYVRQRDASSNATYLAPESGGSPPELRGWKRYQAARARADAPSPVYKPRNADDVERKIKELARPPHFKIDRLAAEDIARSNPPNPPRQGEGDKVATELHALREGTRMKGKVRVHNLRPAELGALVWALAFGEDATREHDSATSFHGLGMGKPFGFGRISLRVVGGRLVPNDPDRRDAMPPLQDILAAARAAFVAEMETAYGAAAARGTDGAPQASWSASPQMTALLSLADAKVTAKPQPYPSLIPAKHAKGSGWASADLKAINEFVQAKKSGALLGSPGQCDVALERRLFPRKPVPAGPAARLPDWYRPPGGFL